MVPVGFFLLVMQAFSELIKRIAFLTGDGPDPFDRKKAAYGAEAEHV
jgi:TRAP-type mannitol/chloroaromatic compound transport system permease small subunit